MATNNYKLFSKILAVTLFTFLVSGAIWVFKNDNDKIVTKQNFENEKSLILKKLNRLHDSISVIMNQNNVYKNELATQNLKIANLINKVNFSSSSKSRHACNTLAVPRTFVSATAVGCDEKSRRSVSAAACMTCETSFGISARCRISPS